MTPLAGLITRRSQDQICPPLPRKPLETGPFSPLARKCHRPSGGSNLFGAPIGRRSSSPPRRGGRDPAPGGPLHRWPGAGPESGPSESARLSAGSRGKARAGIQPGPQPSMDRRSRFRSRYGAAETAAGRPPPPDQSVIGVRDPSRPVRTTRLGRVAGPPARRGGPVRAASCSLRPSPPWRAPPFPPAGRPRHAWRSTTSGRTDP